MANRRDVCLTVIAMLIGAPWSIAEMQKKLSIVKFVDTCDPVWIYYSSVVTAPCTVNIYQYTSENWTVFTRLHIEGRNKTPVTVKERFIGLFGPGSPGMPSITMKVLQLQNDSSDFNIYDDKWTGPDLSDAKDDSIEEIRHESKDGQCALFSITFCENRLRKNLPFKISF
ncbi:uncharacterized protein LOC144135378 isoform X2 [Amblyomma americanum]